MSGIERVAAPWQGVVLVCRKCSKKLDGGFGRKGRETLADALKQVARETGQRGALRFVEVGCLGLCPKRGVTVIGPRAPGEMLVVPKGAAAAAVLGVLRG